MLSHLSVEEYIARERARERAKDREREIARERACARERARERERERCITKVNRRLASEQIETRKKEERKIPGGLTRAYAFQFLFASLFRWNS